MKAPESFGFKSDKPKHFDVIGKALKSRRRPSWTYFWGSDAGLDHAASKSRKLTARQGYNRDLMQSAARVDRYLKAILFTSRYTGNQLLTSALWPPHLYRSVASHQIESHSLVTVFLCLVTRPGIVMKCEQRYLITFFCVQKALSPIWLGVRFQCSCVHPWVFSFRKHAETYANEEQSPQVWILSHLCIGWSKRMAWAETGAGRGAQSFRSTNFCLHSFLKTDQKGSSGKKGELREIGTETVHCLCCVVHCGRFERYRILKVLQSILEAVGSWTLSRQLCKNWLLEQSTVQE